MLLLTTLRAAYYVLFENTLRLQLQVFKSSVRPMFFRTHPGLRATFLWHLEQSRCCHCLPLKQMWRPASRVPPDTPGPLKAVWEWQLRDFFDLRVVTFRTEERKHRPYGASGNACHHHAVRPGRLQRHNSTQLNSTSSWVELCRYRRALSNKPPDCFSWRRSDYGRLCL